MLIQWFGKWVKLWNIELLLTVFGSHIHSTIISTTKYNLDQYLGRAPVFYGVVFISVHFYHLGYDFGISSLNCLL